MSSYSKKTYEQIGMNLALGMSQDLAVATATGKDKTAVNKYAYKVCQHETVIEAMEAYEAEFKKNAIADKSVVEARLLQKVFGDEYEKPSDELGAMKLLAAMNGWLSKDKVADKNAATNRGNAIANMAHKFNNE